MNTNQSVLPLGAINRSTSKRFAVALAGAAALASVVAGAAILERGGDDAERPARPSEQAVLRDLVSRGAIPSQALQPARPSDEAVLRDLVSRGAIPPQALDSAPSGFPR